MAFGPDFAGTALGAVVLTDPNGNVLGTQYLMGQGTAPQIAFDTGTPYQLGTTNNNGLQFIAADGLGNVYVADSGNKVVIKVPPACNPSGLTLNACQAASNVATSANGLGGADGVAVDGAGNLYVADPVNNQVVKIPLGCAATSCTQVIASQSVGGLSTPRELALDGAGDLFIADLNNNQVVEVPAGCIAASCQTALGTGLGAVYGVAVDPAGDVFIADNTNAQVVKLSAVCPGGAAYSCQTTVASALTAPEGISVDAGGNVYIAEGTQVEEVSATTGDRRVLVAGTALGATANITDVAVGPGGSVFIADPGDLQVSRLDRSDPPTINFFPGPTPFGTTTAPLVVTVEDIGNGGLILQSVAAGLWAALDPATTTCKTGATLAVGASCQLGIEFAPTQLQSYNGGNELQGEIVLLSNALNQTYFPQTIFVNGYVSNSQTINFAALPNPVTVGVAPITLQATATSGLPVTFAVSGPASLSGSTLTITAAGSVTVTASQPGNASFQAATSVSQTITVNGVPADFAVASSKASLAVTTAQPGTVTITVTPSGGFNSPVTYSCNQQTLVTCSFNPATQTPTDGVTPVSTTLTVSAASAAASLRASGVRGRMPLTLAFGAAFASFGIIILPIGIPRGNKRKKLVGILAALLIGLAIASVTGCGSGSSSPPPPQSETLTVSASSAGGPSHSVSLTVTVSQ